MSQIHLNSPQEAEEYFSRKLNFELAPADVKKLREEGRDFALIDVRAAEDYQKGHIPGALNLPEGRWNSLAGLDKAKVNVVYCYNQQCLLAARAAFQFATQGYSVMEMAGGFDAWRSFPNETEKEVA